MSPTSASTRDENARHGAGTGTAGSGLRARLTIALAAALAAGATLAAQNVARQPDAPYVPTPQNIVEAMLDLAGVTSADVVYDLGSGDGRIPITAALQHGARAVGIEIDRFRLREAADHAAKAGVADRVRFVNADLFATNIGEATVVTLFLLPDLNQRLITKLKTELRPGARVVSHAFDMGEEWPPERTEEINGLRIYRWTIR